VTLRFSRRALADLDDIYRYLVRRSPRGAANVMIALNTAIQFIVDQPSASPRTMDFDIRVSVLRRYRYKIFYTVVDEGIEILHIRHSSRRPWPGLR
jgi:toxin ParE1/3/4